ncbi:MAG: peptidylprolyl isomerase [Gammaproteobacteria bacterium]|nr:peptidylprolyl isomerase [Gammaproteobacteria bacterium]
MVNKTVILRITTAIPRPGLSTLSAFSLAALCLLLSFQVSAQRVMLDRIIAIVDEDVVLQSELNARLLDVRNSATANNQPLPEDEQLRSEILNTLILENLQLQFAERVSIRFDDDTINRVLNNMALNNNMTFDEYVSALEDAGVYLLTREQVRTQMTIQELQRGMVNRRITITEQEIDNFLNSEMGREVMAAEFYVNHLLISTPSADSEEEKSAKLKYAADLVIKLEELSNFPQVFAEARQSRIFPMDSTDFGWRRADQFPTLFADIVSNMNIGDIEGPIAAGNGFHIIQLAQQRGGTEQIVSQTNIRHIMLEPNEIRNDEQTLAAVEDLRQRIEAGEDFATLARQNSDDASSVVGGGDLDWVSQGGMPPEMEAVIDELAENVISDPFRTETGWHIAEVLGRRESDLSQEYSRIQAENSLRDRKFDLELQNWLIEIREEAFVELID